MKATKRVMVLALVLVMLSTIMVIPAAAASNDPVDPCALIYEDCSCGGAIVFVRHVYTQATEVGDYGEIWVNDIEYDLFKCRLCGRTYEYNHTFSGWYLPG